MNFWPPWLCWIVLAQTNTQEWGQQNRTLYKQFILAIVKSPRYIEVKKSRASIETAAEADSQSNYGTTLCLLQKISSFYCQMHFASGALASNTNAKALSRLHVFAVFSYYHTPPRTHILCFGRQNMGGGKDFSPESWPGASFFLERLCYKSAASSLGQQAGNLLAAVKVLTPDSAPACLFAQTEGRLFCSTASPCFYSSDDNKILVEEGGKEPPCHYPASSEEVLLWRMGHSSSDSEAAPPKQMHGCDALQGELLSSSVCFLSAQTTLPGAFILQTGLIFPGHVSPPLSASNLYFRG